MPRAPELPGADDIGAGALGRHEGEDRQVIVRLDRVVDKGMAQPGAAERSAEGGQPRADGSGAVDPTGRAEVVRDGGERHALQHQAGRRIHAEVRAGRDQCREVGLGVREEALLIRHAYWLGYGSR